MRQLPSHRYLDFDSTVLGQARRSSVQVLPDSLCLLPAPLWDGSSIEVDGAAPGGQRRFHHDQAWRRRPLR